jgi:hypothetical protein
MTVSRGASRLVRLARLREPERISLSLGGSQLDEALIKEGKQMRWLSGDGTIVSPVPSAFDAQLKICREEYRRRHPT